MLRLPLTDNIGLKESVPAVLNVHSHQELDRHGVRMIAEELFLKPMTELPRLADKVDFMTLIRLSG